VKAAAAGGALITACAACCAVSIAPTIALGTGLGRATVAWGGAALLLAIPVVEMYYVRSRSKAEASPAPTASSLPRGWMRLRSILRRRREGRRLLAGGRRLQSAHEIDPRTGRALADGLPPRWPDALADLFGGGTRRSPRPRRQGTRMLPVPRSPSVRRPLRRPPPDHRPEGGRRSRRPAVRPLRAGCRRHISRMT
jgi:hypothetical protein